MKVLYVISTLKRTGPVNLYYNIIYSHNRESFEPVVLTLSPEGEFSRVKDFETLRVPVYSLNLSRLNLILNGRQKFKEILEEIKPDVINSCGVRPDILCALFAKKYKRVTYQQNYPYDDYSMLYGKPGYVLAYLQLQYIRRLNIIVACSHYIGKKIGAIVNKNLPVVSNGVIFGYKKFDNKELDEFRRKLSIMEGSVVFLFAGNLIPRKQPQVIVEAFNLLQKNTNKNIALIILGDGELIKQCKKIAANNPNIQFPGKVADVSPYMQIGHYYVSAALSEGLPVAVIEAMNHGMGVILSDIPQHAEFFKTRIDIGYLFKTGNSKSLQNTMSDALKADYSTISKNAINNVKENFTSEIMANEFEEIYSGL